MDGSMSLSYGNGDLLGTGISVAYNYYQDLMVKQIMRKALQPNNSATSSAQSINVGIPLGSLPVVGDTVIGGAKITAGFNESTQNNKRCCFSGGTVAVTPQSVRFQLVSKRKLTNLEQMVRSQKEVKRSTKTTY